MWLGPNHSNYLKGSGIPKQTHNMSSHMRVCVSSSTPESSMTQCMMLLLLLLLHRPTAVNISSD